jgi:hypothetical protein
VAISWPIASRQLQDAELIEVVYRDLPAVGRERRSRLVRRSSIRKPVTSLSTARRATHRLSRRLSAAAHIAQVKVEVTRVAELDGIAVAP